MKPVHSIMHTNSTICTLSLSKRDGSWEKDGCRYKKVLMCKMTGLGHANDLTPSSSLLAAPLDNDNRPSPSSSCSPAGFLSSSPLLPLLCLLLLSLHVAC